MARCIEIEIQPIISNLRGQTLSENRPIELSILPDMDYLKQRLDSMKLAPLPLEVESYLSCHMIRPTTAIKEATVRQTLLVEEVKRPVVLKSALMQSVAPSLPAPVKISTEIQTESKEMVSSSCDARPPRPFSSSQTQTQPPSTTSTQIQTQSPLTQTPIATQTPTLQASDQQS